LNLKNIHKIEFVNETVIEIQKDETILQASLAAGIPHFHVCGGNAKCSTCRVIIHEGASHLSQPNKAEQKLKQQKNFGGNVRLACQTKVLTGDVKIQRIIKDITDLDIYVYGKESDFVQSIGDEK